MATVEELLLHSLTTYLDTFTAHDGYFRGYVDTKEEFEKFEDNLQEIGMNFSTRRSRTAWDRKGSEEPSENLPTKKKTSWRMTTEIDSKRLLFQQDRGIPIPDLGIPFKVVSTFTKHCPFGETYWGQRACLQNQKRSKLMYYPQVSYKTGCSAKYHYKCVRYFSEFKIDYGPEPLKWHKRYKRQQSLTLLRKMLAKDGSPPQSFDRYYIEIADISRHNHCFASSLTHNLHPMIAMQIKSLVADGIIEFKELKERLGEYVSVLNEAGGETDSSDRNIVYFPSNYFIKKHFNKALRQQEYSQKIMAYLKQPPEIGDDDDGVNNRGGLREDEMIPGTKINVSHEEVVHNNSSSDAQEFEIAAQILHTLHGKGECDTDNNPGTVLEGSYMEDEPVKDLHDLQNHRMIDLPGKSDSVIVQDQTNFRTDFESAHHTQGEHMNRDSEINSGIDTEEHHQEGGIIDERQVQATCTFHTLLGQLKGTLPLCEDIGTMEKVNDMLGLCLKFLQSGITLSDEDVSVEGVSANVMTANYSGTSKKRQGTSQTETIGCDAKRMR